MFASKLVCQDLESLSDRNLKKDISLIGDVESSLLYELPCYYYRFKEPSDVMTRLRCGIMAQDVQQLWPNLVSHNSQLNFLSVDYQGLQILMLKELQKQYKLVQELCSRIQCLERSRVKL
jgi:hypothetical protein